MTLSKIQFDNIIVFGRYSLPPQKMALLLKLPKCDHEEFIFQFGNEESDIRQNWEIGKANAEMEIMEALETTIDKGEEGAGEAAKALGYMKSNQDMNQLKKDLFGV